MDGNISVVMFRDKMVHKNATVEVGYIGSLRTAKFFPYIRNPIHASELLLFCTMGTENFIRQISDNPILPSSFVELTSVVLTSGGGELADK